jgi:hypothetical protein
MNLTKKSKALIAFFMKNNCINNISQTKNTDAIIMELYQEILDSHNYLSEIKKIKNNNIYKINIKKISNISHISKPKNFGSNSFPEEVRNHINEMSLSEITYTFSLFDRKIALHFIVEEADVESKINSYNKYVDSIIMWFYILNEYGSKKCSNTFTVFFYFTSLEKKLPKTNIDILDQIHINTGFTTTCPKDSEIVIFRKEEWFKVLIHESFHNFGLDFSGMDISESTKDILSIFPVNSHVNLYESYTEFWAEILNSVFCSFISLKNKQNIEEFLSNFEFLVNIEKTYSFFQLVKTLDFMGLEYKDMYSKNEQAKLLRNTFYKENTNVLAYYIIKTILINNYQSFLLWCKTNNFSLLQFKKTLASQHEFCNFIRKNYKNKQMLENVKSSEICLDKIKNNKNNNKNLHFLLTNMRMSICELG